MEPQVIFEHLLLPTVIALLGVTAKFVKSIASNIDEISTSVKLLHQEFKFKSEVFGEHLSDHEKRLRLIEDNKPRRLK